MLEQASFDKAWQIVSRDAITAEKEKPRPKNTPEPNYQNI
jgi:hypothetical protein